MTFRKGLRKVKPEGNITMEKVFDNSRYGHVWHFGDEERGDIYFSLAHQGESCASVARRYKVSHSVVQRVFSQMVDGSVTFQRVPGDAPEQVTACASSGTPASSLPRTPPGSLRALKIDFGQFLSSFDRNERSMEPYTAFLDLESGHIEWLYEDDADAESLSGTASENADLRELISRCPSRYIAISALARSEVHGMLDDFLVSDWTSDARTKKRANEAHLGSIGRWIYELGDDDGATVDAFRDFQGDAIQTLAEDFLREQGIEPRWS